MSRRPPISTLFPSTTLFRSLAALVGVLRRAREDLNLVRDALSHDPANNRQQRGRRLDHPAALPRKHECFHNPDRKSTRLNSSHANISYAVFCLKKKKSTLDH